MKKHPPMDHAFQFDRCFIDVFFLQFPVFLRDRLTLMILSRKDFLLYLNNFNLHIINPIITFNFRN